MSNSNNREAVLDGANHSESIECDAIPPHTIESEDLMAMDSVTSHQDELLTHSQVATTNDDATVTSTVSASIMRDNDRQNAITTTTTTAAAAAAVPPPPLSIRTGRDLAILNSSIAPSQVMPAPLAPVPSSPQSIAWNLARRKRRATSSSPGPQPHRRLRLRSPPMSHPYQNYNSPCGSPTTVTAHRFGGNTTGAAGESLGTALSPSSLFGTSASPFASPTALSMAGSISSNGGNGIPSKAFLSGRDLALPRRGRQRAGSLTLLYGAAHAATIVAQAARRSRGHASTQEDSLLMGDVA
ncbi:hypothetical protein BDF22DRAFT_29777 [Syncephalis plumigaleata]|nr:hypothetical protein BDF22DRAFT_29777 [Syncephalis plumigaleata]